MRECVLKRIVRRRKDGKVFASRGMKVGDGPPLMKSSPFEAAVEELPSRIDLRPYCTPVEDQSQSNSCCANAAAGAYEYLCKRIAMENGDDVGDISRLFIYFIGRKNDQVQWNEVSAYVKDEGMTLSGAANALIAQGACLESTWPFELEQVNERPPEEAFDEATDYKITEVKTVPVDVEAMKQCLAEGYPIVFGCKLTEPFFSTGSNGYVQTPDPDDPQSAEHGYHAMLIVGYSDANETFIVRNSWGPDWGDQGYCYMPYDYIGNPEFNMDGMWSARGLTDYDFTPEPGDDEEALFDPDAEPEEDEGIDEEDEDLGEDEEDPDGAEDADMFDMNSIFMKLFNQFDTDGSGTVSESECQALLSKLGVPWFMAGPVFDSMDRDGSGSLSREEFAAAFGPLIGIA